MSNQNNIWKTNWSISGHDESLSPAGHNGGPSAASGGGGGGGGGAPFRSLRSTGNRYSRYAPAAPPVPTTAAMPSHSRELIDKSSALPPPHHPHPADVNNHAHNNSSSMASTALSAQSLIQRAKLSKQHDEHVAGNGYTYSNHLDLSAHTANSYHDDNAVYSYNAAESPMVHLVDEDSPTNSNPYTKRFQDAFAADKRGLSASGKWRSRRAEHLKQNPKQKQPYSSNPIPSVRAETSPTTYKDSRFTRFAQQQLTPSTPSKGSHTPRVSADTAAAAQHESDTHVEQHVQQEEEEDNEPEEWFYKDPSGVRQGPFDTQQMAQWFGDGYFSKELPIRCNGGTPFVMLKDWFLQGMTAFLSDIPPVWPQTNEPVQRNNLSSSGAQVFVVDAKSASATVSNVHRIESDDDRETEDDDAGTETYHTAKSSVADSFYEPSNTQSRMTSIHPRPAGSSNGNSSQEQKQTQSEEVDAINFYLDDKGYYDNTAIKQSAPSSTTASINGHAHITEPNTLAYTSHSVERAPRTKLTPVSAYDCSLAATPPDQKRFVSHPPQQQYYTSSQTTAVDGNGLDYEQQDDEEYNYTPSTGPRESNDNPQMSQPLDNMHALQTHLPRTEAVPLFRSNTDPTHSQQQRDTYQLFQGQDLFANGRRNLSQQPEDTSNRVPSFSADTWTHEVQQGQSTRKYGSLRNGSNGSNPANAANGSNGTSAQRSVLSNGSDKQSGDRKPPMRHKWSDQFLPAAPANTSVMRASGVRLERSRSEELHNENVDSNAEAKKKRKRKRKKAVSVKEAGIGSVASAASAVSGTSVVPAPLKSAMSAWSGTSVGGALGASNGAKPLRLLQAEDENEQLAMQAKQRETRQRRLIKKQKRKVERNAAPVSLAAAVAVASKKEEVNVWGGEAVKKCGKGKVSVKNVAAAAAVSNVWSGNSAKANVSVKKVVNGNGVRGKKKKNVRKVNGSVAVSSELQAWVRTEIGKLNPEVDALSVTNLLSTLDDATVKTTAYHTFGRSKEVTQFVDEFLINRSHDVQEQKSKHAAAAKNGAQHKKKRKKARR